jgi:succinate dehydrogenase flavin-adding protein (antitoxin of CptAB toxin-antitoxin module)
MTAKIDEQELKKVLYRSNYRGCKETDILIGKFATQELYNFTPDEFKLFQELLDENDWDIYNWLVGKTPPPERYQVLINQILDFNAKGFE